MRIRNLTALCLALLLLAAPLLAESGSDALQKALDKCSKQHAAIHDMTVTQQITIPSPEGIILAEQKSFEKGDKSRMEMTMQPPAGVDTNNVPPGLGKVTTISDGKVTWLISPMMGKQQVPDKNDPSSANCWGLKFQNATVTGSDTVNGHQCWIIESNKADTITDKYWLDKTKFDVLKGESKDQEGHILRWELSDFRPILGNFDYPYKMDVFAGDTVVASMSVKNITINTGLPDTLFDPDKVEVSKTDMEQMLRELMKQQGGDSNAPLMPDTTGLPKK